jgi:hypothetical protein
MDLAHSGLHHAFLPYALALRNHLLTIKKETRSAKLDFRIGFLCDGDGVVLCFLVAGAARLLGLA